MFRQKWFVRFLFLLVSLAMSISELPDPYPTRVSGPMDASVRPPGSKSLSNRALVLAALAEGTSRLSGVLASEDTHVMIDAWRRLGVRIDGEVELGKLIVHGCGGVIPVDEADLFLANSGTSIRFLSAAVATGRGHFVLDGVERMRQRPIGDLLDSLTALGVDATSLNGDGCPPVVIVADGLSGGKTTVAGGVSSQFLSALMMAAPSAKTNLEIHVRGELVSRPYVAMTAEIMKSFGVSVTGVPLDTKLDGQPSEPCDWSGPFTIVAPQRYRAADYDIEPDASAASYFWAAAAIAGGTVRVEGLTRKSLQGDVGFVDVLAKMGCRVTEFATGLAVTGLTGEERLRGLDLDMGHISDTVQTLAAVALFADGPTRVRGVAHNRHKETDRIGDLATELRKLGATVTEHDDGLTIEPGPLRPATIDTYNDHRMAMSLALVGLRVPGLLVNNPLCTGKTYPSYWQDLNSVITPAPGRE